MGRAREGLVNRKRSRCEGENEKERGTLGGRAGNLES